MVFRQYGSDGTATFDSLRPPLNRRSSPVCRGLFISNLYLKLVPSDKTVLFIQTMNSLFGNDLPKCEEKLDGKGVVLRFPSIPREDDSPLSNQSLPSEHLQEYLSYFSAVEDKVKESLSGYENNFEDHGLKVLPFQTNR